MKSDCFLNWSDLRQISGPCIRPGGPVLTERALGICSLPPRSRIADIGCGAGGTLKHLEHSGIYRLTGLDCSETLLGEAATRLTPGSLVRGRAEALPFRQDLFDALFCECVLSILNDRITSLHEFARVLKKGGFLIISDVFGQDPSLQGRTDGNPQRRLTKGLIMKDDLIGLLAGMGFTMLLWEDHERFLKEFVAQMILAGEGLPDQWHCGLLREEKMAGRSRISYFLLVARKGIAKTD